MKWAACNLAIMLLFLSISAFTQNKTPQLDFKFGKGLNVIAPDSSIALKIGFRFQSLLAAERNLVNEENWGTTFQIRRARLKFDGWALSSRLKYKIELGLSNKDISPAKDNKETGGASKIILDAVIKYRLNKHFELWAGQTKLPGNRERVVSSQKLQFVDRSLVNSVFNLDREMGLQLRSNFQLGNNWILKPGISLSFGEGRNIITKNIGGYHYVGRLELLPFGEFTGGGDYFQSDLARETSVKLALGASFSYNQNASRQSHTGRFLVDSLGNYLTHDLNTLLLDFIVKYRGFSMMGEYARKKITDLSPSKENIADRDDLIDPAGRSYLTGTGFNLQLSYLFKSNFEIATRITGLTPDSAVSFSQLHEYTLGLSKYISGHNLKIQSDISLINFSDTGQDYLRYRLQMEFAF